MSPGVGGPQNEAKLQLEFSSFSVLVVRVTRRFSPGVRSVMWRGVTGLMETTEGSVHPEYLGNVAGRAVVALVSIHALRSFGGLAGGIRSPEQTHNSL